MTKTTREDFEYWLADMYDALDRFLETLPKETRARLDFSPDSLDILEAWILDRYDNNKKMLEPNESHILDGIARYIGETFRNSLGGYWDIQLGDPRYVYYGLPILTGFSKKSNTECPLTLATASADRRNGKYLSTVLKNMMRRHLDTKA